MKMEIEEKEIQDLLKDVFLSGIELGKILGRIERLEEDLKEIKKLKER